MAPSCLIIVDVQKGFINEWTEMIPAAVEAAQADYDIVFATKFVNAEGSPYRRLIGWGRFAPGSPDTELAFKPRADAQIVEKGVYTCVSPTFLGEARERGLETVHLCGIATDSCVLKTAVDLFEAGLTPMVHAELCASHGGRAIHESALVILRRFIDESQVV